MDKKTVVKIGGSLINEAPQLIRHISESRHLYENQIIFIPGGGVFADFIREKEHEFGLNNNSSHWMAVLAMEQYGYYLAEKTMIPIITTLGDNQHPVSIFLPYHFLTENDQLPHMWDITSDTIAAFVAVCDNADFIKVTDVDGVLVDREPIEQINATELASMGKTCTDMFFPVYLKNSRLDCFVLNGKYPERLLENLQGKKTIGTLIKGNI